MSQILKLKWLKGRKEQQSEYQASRQRLKVLKLPSLLHSRRRCDMLETYKIATNISNVDKSHFFEFSSTPSRGRTAIQLSRLKSTNPKLFASRRVFTDWNTLPNEVVQPRTVNEFKAKIDEQWDDKQYITPFD